MGSKPLVRPPRLARGSRVALVAPAGPLLERDDITRAEELCRALDYEPVLGPHAGGATAISPAPTTTGWPTSMPRFRDSADRCGLVPSGRLRRHPDPRRRRFRGPGAPAHDRSSATRTSRPCWPRSLGRAGMVAFHAPTARAEMPSFSRRHFARVLTRAASRPGSSSRWSPPADVLVPRTTASITLRGGVAEGALAGGNLTLLQCLIGTRYFPDLDGALLVLEDVNEDLYRIDRMLAHLRAVGALARLRGVLVGRFTGLKRHMDDGAFGVDEVLTHYFAPLGVPVLYGLPDRAHRRPVDPAARRARPDRRGRGTLELLEPRSPRPRGRDRGIRPASRAPHQSLAFGMATPTLTRHRCPASSAKSWSTCAPAGRGSPRPAVVVVHGFKGFKDWGLWPPLAERLARAGVSAVTLNLSGSGVDDAGEFVYPERFGHNTFSAELQDLRRVIDALARRRARRGAAHAVGLLGHSRGGGIAVLHTAADPRVRALVTWAAISTVERWPASRARRVARRGRAEREERAHRTECCRCTPTCSTTSSATPPRSTSRRRRRGSPCRGSSSTAPRTRRWPWPKASGWRPRRARAPAFCRSRGRATPSAPPIPWRGATPELERVAGRDAGLLRRESCR